LFHRFSEFVLEYAALEGHIREVHGRASRRDAGAMELLLAMSCTSVTTTSFEALRKAKTEIGSGHNSFVYVPESPLAREDASTLPLGRVKLRYGPTSQCHTRRRTGVSGRVGDGWWFKPRFGG